ncbi:two-component response regulator CreC [Klebsiella aerogenes]|nr:two-component response regulator CreC [Klebsiella aerogenes]
MTSLCGESYHPALAESGMLVNGDGELLAQALGNLLDNAIDFTPRAARSPWLRRSEMKRCN